MKLNAVLLGLATFLCASGVFARSEAGTPPELTPPPGNVAYLTTHAAGTQNYICLPSANGTTVWTFLSPQATLSSNLGRFDQQVATHFLSTVPTDSPTAQPACTLSGDGRDLYCPSWQSSTDSSAVWGARAGSVPAGMDATCPNAGSIPCLLLKAVGNRPGTHGHGIFSRATYVQRLHTNGGSAPTASCSVGAVALVPYTADYTFFAAERGQPNPDGQ